MVQSTLVTQEPYHLPGYLGYVPQFKFRIGGTYGQTTHNILHTSDRTEKKPQFRLIEEQRFQEPLSRMRPATQEGWNNTKLRGAMVPGYTGFVPKGQHYFGECYAKSCDNALQSFEKDLVVKERNDETFRMVPRKTLISSYCRDSAYPVKQRQFAYGTSPYKLPSTHDEKYFVSGYTGFVPRSRELLAKSYPELTHQALNIHHDDKERSMGIISTSGRRPTARPKTCHNTIYSKQSGLTPNYTGHVPEFKFKYGQTYGATTVDALNKIR